MSRLLGLGARFPEFSLQACVSAEPGSEFRTVDSHELEGRWTAIFFWPLDFTFVCPTELVEFNHALREFRALAARVFGVSGDSHHAHLAWRKENPALRNLEFPMVADAGKELADRARNSGSDRGGPASSDLPARPGEEDSLALRERSERGPKHRGSAAGPRGASMRGVVPGQLESGAGDPGAAEGHGEGRPVGDQGARRPPLRRPPVNRCAASPAVRRYRPRTRTRPCCA